MEYRIGESLGNLYSLRGALTKMTQGKDALTSKQNFYEQQQDLAFTKALNGFSNLTAGNTWNNSPRYGLERYDTYKFRVIDYRTGGHHTSGDLRWGGNVSAFGTQLGNYGTDANEITKIICDTIFYGTALAQVWGMIKNASGLKEAIITGTKAQIEQAAETIEALKRSVKFEKYNLKMLVSVHLGLECGCIGGDVDYNPATDLLPLQNFYPTGAPDLFPTPAIPNMEIPINLTGGCGIYSANVLNGWQINVPTP